jgi:hypothetical protein
MLSSDFLLDSKDKENDDCDFIHKEKNDQIAKFSVKSIPEFERHLLHELDKTGHSHSHSHCHDDHHEHNNHSHNQVHDNINLRAAVIHLIGDLL